MNICKPIKMTWKQIINKGSANILKSLILLIIWSGNLRRLIAVTVKVIAKYLEKYYFFKFTMTFTQY